MKNKILSIQLEVGSNEYDSEFIEIPIPSKETKAIKKCLETGTSNQILMKKILASKVSTDKKKLSKLR